MSGLSRRDVLISSIIGAASLTPPLLISSSSPAAHDPILQLIDHASQMNEAHARAIQNMKLAERRLRAWDLRNPRPRMRECVVGTEREYAIWWADVQRNGGDEGMATAFDPNADLKAAVREHNLALSNWSARRAVAEEKAGYRLADDQEDAAAERSAAALEQLTKAVPTCFAALAAKARFARGEYHEALTASLERDIGILAGDPEETVRAG